MYPIEEEEANYQRKLLSVLNSKTIKSKTTEQLFFIYFCKNILSSSIEVKSNVDYIHNYNVLSEVIMVSRYVKEKEQLSL